MNRKLSLDINTLNKVLEDPDFEQESQGVHSFVESIIGQKFNQKNLTSKHFLTLHQKCNEFLLNPAHNKGLIDEL